MFRCLIVLLFVSHALFVSHTVQLVLPGVVSLRSLFTFNHCVVRGMCVFACVNLQATHSQPAMDTTYWRYDVTLSHIVASIVVFFFVLFLNYNLDITVPLVFLVACGECRCNLYGHMDAAVYVCTCLGVWLCVYAWRINTISKCSMCVNSVFVSNLFFVHCPLSSLCMSLLIHSSSKFFVVQRIKSTLEP